MRGMRVGRDWIDLAFNFFFQPIVPFGLLNVVPNSNPLGMKRFVRGISISFKYECTLGARGYFFRLVEGNYVAHSAERKKITSGHTSNQPHFHVTN